VCWPLLCLRGPFCIFVLFFSLCIFVLLCNNNFSFMPQADLKFLSFFLNNTETESNEKQVVAGLCLFSETQPETGSISQFDSWECKSAGNFRMHRKCMCKLRNLPIHGNVNQPETSASIGNDCVNSGIC
jgi:hypothetical protein